MPSSPLSPIERIRWRRKWSGISITAQMLHAGRSVTEIAAVTGRRESVIEDFIRLINWLEGTDGPKTTA